MKTKFTLLFSLFAFVALGQSNWQAKFEQMDNMLPTPNQYRTGSGEPGPDYWQQKADYKIKIELDDENQKITGSEEITYYNNLLLPAIPVGTIRSERKRASKLKLTY